MWMMYIGYVVFYFICKSFNFIMFVMFSDLGLMMLDVGVLGMLFYIIYGCFKFILGMISDWLNLCYFMGIGLVMIGIINILFGMSLLLLVFGVLWILNVFFQGWGWLLCFKILISWYFCLECGGWWVIWNMLYNFGGVLIFLLVGFIFLYFSWCYGMIISGIIGVVIGLLMCWWLCDKLSIMGLLSVGKWCNDVMELV